MHDDPALVPLTFRRRPPEEVLRRGREILAEMARRRTIRHFATDPVPREAIELAIRAAGTAPSGAHQQPWTFVAVSDPAVQARIREAAEEEERRNYAGRMPPEWLEALEPLGTDAVKTHLTDAPWVIVLFRQLHGTGPDGARRTHYYTSESCGIAAGFLIAALHRMGLATLTHTPSPMGFLSELLRRPAREKPFLVIPVGYPARGARVPDLVRRPLEEISVWIEDDGG
jgi:iodotyrosine deiodinase